MNFDEAERFNNRFLRHGRAGLKHHAVAGVGYCKAVCGQALGRYGNGQGVRPVLAPAVFQGAAAGAAVAAAQFGVGIAGGNGRLILRNAFLPFPVCGTQQQVSFESVVKTLLVDHIGRCPSGVPGAPTLDIPKQAVGRFPLAILATDVRQQFADGRLAVEDVDRLVVSRVLLASQAENRRRGLRVVPQPVYFGSNRHRKAPFVPTISQG